MATPLLDDDGTASIATIIMCSHHAFGRDLACFATALAATDIARADALRAAWAKFRGALQHHHSLEETSVFPDLRANHPDLTRVLAELDAQHRAIDPVLARGDQVFAQLPHAPAAARDVIESLRALLASHLDLEEAAVIPRLRGAKHSPAPTDEDELAACANGYAWVFAGIASSVLDHIFAILPAALRARLPAARKAFDACCLRTWGHVHAGQSTMSAA